jgi:hypothetical protein
VASLSPSSLHRARKESLKRITANAEDLEPRETSSCSTAKLSAIAARRPEKEMPLAEIDAEAQRHRKEKRSRKA